MPTPPYIQDANGSIREGQTVTPTDVMVLSVEDRDLSFIRVDHQLRLQFGGTEVVIETPFTLAGNGEQRRLDPQDRQDLGPVLGLYPDVLQTLAVDPDGTLRLDLESGSSLTVPPNSTMDTIRAMTDSPAQTV